MPRVNRSVYNTISTDTKNFHEFEGFIVNEGAQRRGGWGRRDDRRHRRRGRHLCTVEGASRASQVPNDEKLAPMNRK
ncbi:hypothetical protein SERLA73DRAFT_190475 [Serpula lacrymans var. lacrymans S7.3]|uniref:Uncharacterized protein n=1 Tax=Serpula lacrymans var. lacrymans (strain S7.3) TaxID=936435 RepID=F8QFP3_SERL3|nr:hypothetical protein SERLA73DRAFT_190475 [Serpula lacrymans var. lacrymans S7.3]